MSAYTSQIANCLQQFQKGDREGAFFTLLESNDSIIPDLIDAFNKESDKETQAFLVNVIWQYRQPTAIPFLGNALLNSEPIVWKEAMDGLVTLASPESLDALLSARSRHFSKTHDREEFFEWLEEAIEQVQKEMPIV